MNALSLKGCCSKACVRGLTSRSFGLLITKFSAVVWELAEVTTLNPKKWSCLKRLEVCGDLGFALLYLTLGLGILGSYSLTIYFSIAVMCDAVFYDCHKMLQNKFSAMEGCRVDQVAS